MDFYDIEHLEIGFYKVTMIENISKFERNSFRSSNQADYNIQLCSNFKDLSTKFDKTE